MHFVNFKDFWDIDSNFHAIYLYYYCWNLLLMIHLWSYFNGALSYKPIQEFYMIKSSQTELLLMCIVMINRMLKALKHTHIIAY